MANSNEENHYNILHSNMGPSSLQSGPMLYSDPENSSEPNTNSWSDPILLNSSIGASSASSSCYFSSLSHTSTLPSASTTQPTPTIKLPDRHLKHQPQHPRFTNWLANSKLLAEPVQTGQEQAHQTHPFQSSPTCSTFSSASSSPEHPSHLPKFNFPSNWPLPPPSPSSPFASRSSCKSPSHSERPQRLRSLSLCPITRKLTMSCLPQVLTLRQRTTSSGSPSQPFLPLPFTPTISHPMPAFGSFRPDTQAPLKSPSLLTSNRRRATTTSTPMAGAIPAISHIHRQSAYSLTSEMTEDVAFEDAREQAEWMDIDHGDAYEDLARTKEIAQEATVWLSAPHCAPERVMADTARTPCTKHSLPKLLLCHDPGQLSPEQPVEAAGPANRETTASPEEHRPSRPSSAVALFTRSGVWEDNGSRSDSRTYDREPLSAEADVAPRGWRRKPLILRPTPSARWYERSSVLPSSSVTSCSNTSSEDHPRPRPFTPPDLLSRYTTKPSPDWLDEKCHRTAPVNTQLPETVYEDEQDEANEVRARNLWQKRDSVGRGRWSVISSKSVKAFDERELDRVGLAVFLEDATAGGKQLCQAAPRAMRALRCGSHGVCAGEQARFSVVRPDELYTQPLEPTGEDMQPATTLPTPQQPRESLIVSVTETLGQRPQLVSLYKSAGETQGAVPPDAVHQRKTSFGLRQNLTAAASRVRKTSMPALIRRRSAMTHQSLAAQRSSALGSQHKPGPSGVSATLMRLQGLDCKLVDVQLGRKEQEWIKEEQTQKKIGGKLRVISRPALLTDQDERHVLWEMIRRGK